MKIYLAAPWIDRNFMKEFAQMFEQAGFTITHKWWLTEPMGEGTGKEEILKSYAIKDRQGVLDCDILVVLNTSKSEGKAVEQGIAMEHNKPIIAIGKLGDGTSVNVFHYLDCYTWVPTVDKAIEELNARRSK